MVAQVSEWTEANWSSRKRKALPWHSALELAYPSGRNRLLWAPKGTVERPSARSLRLKLSVRVHVSVCRLLSDSSRRSSTVFPHTEHKLELIIRVAYATSIHCILLS